jgi:chromosome transmission fidelity protein 4
MSSITIADICFSLVRGQVHLTMLRHANDAVPDSELQYMIKEREVSLDKEMLQLVQGACKADNLQRALDVTRLMHNMGTLDAASKVAAFYHLPGLQERIQVVKESKEDSKRKSERERRGRAREYAENSSVANGYGNGHSVVKSAGPNGKSFTEFAPREKGPKRTFGGVVRDETPASTMGRASVVPETPREEVEPTPFPQTVEDDEEADRGIEWSASPEPEFKRKRVEDVPVVDEFTPAPKKRAEESASVPCEW